MLFDDLALTGAQDDKSGKLGFEEFKKLWTDLRQWKGIFKQYDTDKSGNLNSYELRKAFHGIGTVSACLCGVYRRSFFLSWKHDNVFSMRKPAHLGSYVRFCDENETVS